MNEKKCPECGSNNVKIAQNAEGDVYYCGMCGQTISTEYPDPVNHPSHYTTGSIEVIDFITDQKFGYLLGNATKYISRCRHKGKFEEDLRKAIWYIQKAIEVNER